MSSLEKLEEYTKTLQGWISQTGRAQKDLAKLTAYFDIDAGREHGKPLSDSQFSRTVRPSKLPARSEAIFNVLTILGVLYGLDIIGRIEIERFLLKYEIPIPDCPSLDDLWPRIEEGRIRLQQAAINRPSMEKITNSLTFEAHLPPPSTSKIRVPARSRLIPLLWSSLIAIGVLTFLIFGIFNPNRGKNELLTQNAAGHLTITTSVAPTSLAISTQPPQLLSPLSTVTTSTLIATSSLNSSLCGEFALVKDEPIGERFIPDQGVSSFTIENTPKGILDNRVRAVAGTDKGVIVGYFNFGAASGLSYYLRTGEESWAICNDAGAMVGKLVNSIVVDQSKRIWVATDGGGILMWDGQEWHAFTETKDKRSLRFSYGLALDAQGNVWAGTSEGVAQFTGEDWELTYTVYKELSDNRVHNLAFDSLNNIWVGHLNAGLSEFVSAIGEWKSYKKGQEIGGDLIRGIAVRKASDSAPESIWFATWDGGISRFEGNNWKTYGIEDGLPSLSSVAIAVDSLNRVWVGTDKGTSYFDGTHWIRYNTLSTLSISFSPNCPDYSCPQEDNIWTGTERFGLTHSRLPYAEEALKVDQICFESLKRELICPAFASLEYPSVITATYPQILAPGEKFNFQITVSPVNNHELKVGDFLSYAGENQSNLFGAFQLVEITETIPSGQSFVFNNRKNMFVAPELPVGQEKLTFISPWRVWMHTRYTGPEIRIVFTVKQTKEK